MTGQEIARLQEKARAIEWRFLGRSMQEQINERCSRELDEAIRKYGKDE